MPDPVAVYIPNLNGGDRLLEVLDALAEQTVPARVVVVDNASTDGSPDAAQARHDDIVMIRLDRNY
jgi:GT2 family glycosyltransferase